MAFDYKKEYKEFYIPQNKPSIVEVPPMNYIAVRGKGNPNAEDSEYKQSIGLLYCQTAHCGRCKPHFDFGVIASPIVPYRNLPQAPDGMTADCRSLVSKAAGAAFEIRP